MNAMITLLDDETLQPQLHILIDRDHCRVALVAHDEVTDAREVKRALDMARAIRRRIDGIGLSEAATAVLDTDPTKPQIKEEPSSPPEPPPLVVTGSGVVPATQQGASDWLSLFGAIVGCAAVIVFGIFAIWPALRPLLRSLVS